VAKPREKSSPRAPSWLNKFMPIRVSVFRTFSWLISLRAFEPSWRFVLNFGHSIFGFVSTVRCPVENFGFRNFLRDMLHASREAALRPPRDQTRRYFFHKSKKFKNFRIFSNVSRYFSKIFKRFRTFSNVFPTHLRIWSRILLAHFARIHRQA